MRNCLFAIIFSLPILTFSQSKVYIGVRGAGQLGSAYIEHTIRTKNITTDFVTGYNAGIIAKIFTKKRDAVVNPGLQTGLVLDQKGWGQIFPETDQEKYKLKLSYIQLPMEAAINFGKGRTKAFFTMGWYLEYLVSVSKSEMPDTAALSDRRIDFYTYDNSRDRRLGYGGRVSVGGQRDFSWGAVHIDAFITFSISSVINHQDFKTEIPDLSNLYTIGFSVAYMLPFGKLDY